MLDDALSLILFLHLEVDFIGGLIALSAVGRDMIWRSMTCL